jgi:hypothetical protein
VKRFKAAAKVEYVEEEGRRCDFCHQRPGMMKVTYEKNSIITDEEVACDICFQVNKKRIINFEKL